MKKILSILITTAFSLVLQPAFAQLGGPPTGPKFDGALAKVFGDNSAFTATLESQIKPKSGDTITMPGKMSFDSGKSRIEMDLASATGLKLPPGAAEQMKAMGLDQMTTLTLPEKKALYLIYPGLKSYVENPLPDAGSTTNDDYKVTKTEMGKETVDGHPSVENKVVVTDAKGVAKEFTVWNATDMKDFPVKIVHAEKSNEITMTFKNVQLIKPAASTFELPADYTRYESMQAMMQAEMMKKMGGGMGMPMGK